MAAFVNYKFNFNLPPPLLLDHLQYCINQITLHSQYFKVRTVYIIIPLSKQIFKGVTNSLGPFLIKSNVGRN